MLRADAMFERLRASRLDNSTEAEMRQLAQVRLLIIDDFALQPPDGTATDDFYELVVARHQRSATIVTSNRGPDEWLTVMTDAMLAESARRPTHLHRPRTPHQRNAKLQLTVLLAPPEEVPGLYLHPDHRRRLRRPAVRSQFDV
jgi:hypothetical protein